MRLQVLGCGDAFGSGGRFHTCFHLTLASTCFLVDCGASALIAMRRFGVDPNAIETIFISHLHGDHFGGLPFFLLDAQFVSRRAAPLTIAGPPGLRRRLADAMEVLFPGSSTIERRFVTRTVELEPEAPATINGVAVTAYPVRHPSGAPAFALRLVGGCGKVLSYTGDTEWVEALLPAGRDADLLIAEAYTAERAVPFHLDWATLQRYLPALAPKRLLLTHMGAEMLARAPDLAAELAEDGLIVEI
jgi:ribonuclease BN (tRNA processing enzyme)